MTNLKTAIHLSLGTSPSSIIKKVELETEYELDLILKTIDEMFKNGELILIKGGYHSVEFIQEEILFIIGNQVMAKRSLIAVVRADLKVNSWKVSRSIIKTLIHDMIKKDWLINAHSDFNSFENYTLYKLNTDKFNEYTQ